MSKKSKFENSEEGFYNWLYGENTDVYLSKWQREYINAYFKKEDIRMSAILKRPLTSGKSFILDLIKRFEERKD